LPAVFRPLMGGGAVGDFPLHDEHRKRFRDMDPSCRRRRGSPIHGHRGQDLLGRAVVAHSYTPSLLRAITGSCGLALS
jgi:hypothetical protein